jgi:hypothetical protein
MSQKNPTILYFFIFLILIASVSLFIFKDKIAGKLLSYEVGISAINLNNKATSSDLKLDVLKDSRIKALKNYISIFSYDNLDKSQEAILASANKPSDVIITNPDETSTTTATTTKGLIRVRVGNSNPFLTTKKAAK